MHHFDKLMGPHSDEVQWLKKRALAAAGLDRAKFGTVETHLGTVAVSHDRGADTVCIHGVTAHLSDIDRDLRTAIVATSAAFSRAE